MSNERVEGRSKHPLASPASARRSAARPSRFGRLFLSPAVLLGQVLVFLCVAVFGALWLLEGRLVPVPEALSERIEAQAESALQADLDLGALYVTAEGGGVLRLVAEDVRLFDPSGEVRANLPRVEARLGLSRSWPLKPIARAVHVEGADLAILRNADGTLDLGSAVLSAIFSRTPPRTPVEAAERVRTAFNRPAMAGLDDVVLDLRTFRLDDLRAGRTWEVPDATLRVRRGQGRLSVALDLRAAGRVSLRASMPQSGSLDLEVSALLADVPAQDIATQVPALVWLDPLVAPVSGALIGQYAPNGTLTRLDGTLSVDTGHLAAASGERTLFDNARAYVSYSPATSRLTFSELVVTAPSMHFEGEGHAYLHSSGDRFAEAMTAQLILRSAQLPAASDDLKPVSLKRGALDAHIRFSPFSVDIGHLSLSASGAPGGPLGAIELGAHGRIASTEEGVAVDLAVTAPELAPGDVLNLWPVGTLPGTRAWLARNLLEARLIGAAAEIALRPGARPDVALTFGFEESTVRVLAGMPPIQNGAGRASLVSNQFSISVERGEITPPVGGVIDVAGSSFTIRDTRQRPGLAEVAWVSSSPIASALSLIDQPPLRLMQRVGRPVDLADGTVDLRGMLRFPIKPAVPPEELDYAFTGDLRSVRSEVLVPSRALSADSLSLAVAPSGLEIAGAAVLDGIATDVVYRQPFGADAASPTVVARADLSAATAEAFNVSLPAGLLSGSGEVEVSLRFPQGSPAELRLLSDLRGLGLSIPALGWSKPPGASGALEVQGVLPGSGQPIRIDRFALSSPGLELAGNLRLAANGGLSRLALQRARIGRWFNGAVELAGGGGGRPLDLTLQGGRLDLRQAPFAAGASRSGPPAGRVRGRLDRVELADGVALTGVSLDVRGAGGGSGQFSGRVNTGPSVTGVLEAGAQGRPSLRVTAADAGGVLAAAGVFEGAQGGTLEAQLQQERRAGTWSGTLDVDGIRVTAAPGLAALLNTISVVGLLDQLNGPGLLFSTIRSAFRLTPDGVEITSGSAVGPSLGVSVEGIYDTGADRIDLRGVLSPVYFVNAIGQVFTREGEGLLGMTYTVDGPISRPRVRVNPLSLLTPGAFREIFQSPVPRLPESTGQ